MGEGRGFNSLAPSPQIHSRKKKMLRHRAICRHCGAASPWQSEPGEVAAVLATHLEEHQVSRPRAGRDYDLIAQRQCHYCLEEFVDTCTKCERDFCRFHTGDIDGLCGCCI